MSFVQKMTCLKGFLSMFRPCIFIWMLLALEFLILRIYCWRLFPWKIIFSIVA
uniref:Uncharacterized protein n=1 Tax=Rhizophora mucronata TaxID=61149 RepID=A0A2P2QUN2_RHIMU